MIFQIFFSIINLNNFYSKKNVGKISFIKKFTILSNAKRFTFSLLIFRNSIVDLLLLFLFGNKFEMLFFELLWKAFDNPLVF